MGSDFMTKEQYHIQLERLSGYYGAGKVTRQFVERVWKHVENLPYYNFIRIVDNVLDGSRYLPTPKEFADLARLERASIRNPTEDNSTIIECSPCGDTGFLWANGFEGLPVWMFCSCEVGERRVKEKNFRLMKFMPQLGLAPREFPTKFFIPPKVDLSNRSDEEIHAIQFNFVQRRMVEFKRDLQESEKYWASLGSKS